MKGIILKNFLAGKGYNVSEIARIIGVLQQTLAAALNSEDVKSSLIERVASAVGASVSEIYGEKTSLTATMHGGNGNKMINGTGNTMTEGMPADVVALKREIELLQKMVDDKDAELKRKVDETNELLEIIQKLTTMKSQI